MEHPTCGRCRYSLESYPVQDGTTYRCHWDPPVILGNGVWAFPCVAEDDWCSRFEPRPSPCVAESYP